MQPVQKKILNGMVLTRKKGHYWQEIIVMFFWCLYFVLKELPGDSESDEEVNDIASQPLDVDSHALLIFVIL